MAEIEISVSTENGFIKKLIHIDEGRVTWRQTNVAREGEEDFLVDLSSIPEAKTLCIRVVQ